MTREDYDTIRAALPQIEELDVDVSDAVRRMLEYQTTPDLKPCPFCGSRKRTIWSYGNGIDQDYVVIQCDGGCGGQVVMEAKKLPGFDELDHSYGDYSSDEPALIPLFEAWNRRAAE